MKLFSPEIPAWPPSQRGLQSGGLIGSVSLQGPTQTLAGWLVSSHWEMERSEHPQPAYM